MPSTYDKIATHTLPSNATDYTFTTISQAYTDLVLIVGNLTNTTAQTLYARVGNGSVDTGSNYSYTEMNGTSAAFSNRGSNVSNGLLMGALSQGLSSSTPATVITQFQNYSNTTTNKTSLSRYNLASAEVSTAVALWRSTAAINTITVRTTGGSIQTGTTFTLYGIKAA